MNFNRKFSFVLLFVLALCAAQTNKNFAQALPAGYVSHGGLTWMSVSTTDYTYAEATALCAGTINGQTGWRLPTVTELTGLTPPIALGAIATGGLYGSGETNGQGWTLSDTWSSSPLGVRSHSVVDLGNGKVSFDNEANSNFVTCVRSKDTREARADLLIEKRLSEKLK